MMVNKRLINLVPESKPHIIKNVVYQWISLISNIVIMFSIAGLLSKLISNDLHHKEVSVLTAIMVVSIIIRFICTRKYNKESFLASRSVKKTLRELIYKKLLRLGTEYSENASTAEVVQVSVEGVEQLEIYFASYLPQFFYSLLAPITLFIVLSFISFKSALVLLLCVPLIPVSIIAVQKFAKKLLAKYWGQYTKLGDSFLENLQGLTTLKIYQSDKYKHEEMNKEAEHFRKITMKVLTMQLNSITLMDLIAYGGAAIGVIVSTMEFSKGNISSSGCFVIIMLAADFFLPLRLLGSFFHVAMNGMAASDKIFKLLDLKENEEKTVEIGENTNVEINNLTYSYDGKRNVLNNINMSFPKNSFTSIVGESGCGKSTIVSLIMGANKDYNGSLSIGGNELSIISRKSLMKNITLISSTSYIFKGTVRDNLLMACPDATDNQLWSALKSVNLDQFLLNENGLDTMMDEKGSNFSGGQCQRLALARAILHDSEIYIFDEATSNIDVESENDIMKYLKELAKMKTVILVSHRLANVVSSDNIYVLDKGNLIENGKHKELLSNNNVYAKLWNSQKELEEYVGGIENEKKIRC